MNKANVLKLAAHMEQMDPSEYDQRRVVLCGSPACVAGHAAWLAGKWEIEEGSDWMYEEMNWQDSLLEVAEHWLGIESATAYELFMALPLGPLLPQPTPQDAAATLRHLAATGVVRWHKVNAADERFKAFLREIFSEESEA